MTPTNLTARIEAMINESTDAHENGDNTVSALSVALLLLDVQAHLAQSPLREAPAPQASPGSKGDLEAAKSAMLEAHRQLGGAMDCIQEGEGDSALGRIENARKKMDEVEEFLSRPAPSPGAAPTTEKGGEG